MSNPTNGEIAYNAYRESSFGGRWLSGAEMPMWADLPLAVQWRWQAAASAVRHRTLSEVIDVLEEYQDEVRS